MTEATLSFASGDVLAQWATLKQRNRLLAEIALALADYAFETHGWLPIRITSIYRTPEEDIALKGHGVHPAWRAVDVGAREVPPETRADVARFVNERYVYDPQRPGMVVAYAQPHGSGPHVHLQTHERTAYRCEVTA